MADGRSQPRRRAPRGPARECQAHTGRACHGTLCCVSTAPTPARRRGDRRPRCAPPGVQIVGPSHRSRHRRGRRSVSGATATADDIPSRLATMTRTKSAPTSGHRARLRSDQTQPRRRALPTPRPLGREIRMAAAGRHPQHPGMKLRGEGLRRWCPGAKLASRAPGQGLCGRTQAGQAELEMGREPDITSLAAPATRPVVL